MRPRFALTILAAFAATAGATDFLTLTTEGENAPEALVRVVETRRIGADLISVRAKQGPCLQRSLIETAFVIQAAEPVQSGDLFFKVPDTGRSGFALRRATPEEHGMYKRCRWK